jgi:hypothetical protein
MSSQHDALTLRRSGLVSGYFPAGVPRELRADLIQPINPHRASDHVEPIGADVATRLDEAGFRAAFGSRQLVEAVEEPSLAQPVDEPSLAGDFGGFAAAIVAPGAGTADASTAAAADATATTNMVVPVSTLNRMTRDELVELADARNVAVADSDTKATLIEHLTA